MTKPQPVRDPESPIILSLGGGYRLTSAAAGVQFDIRNDGNPVRVAWTEAGSANAFLAVDCNGNGAIDSGAELFGNSTPLQSGGIASHGFAALSELDGNGDGVVHHGDAAWGTLLLWTDSDHDGRSAPGELQPVSGSGVTALETARARSAGRMGGETNSGTWPTTRCRRPVAPTTTCSCGQSNDAGRRRRR